MKSWYLGVYKDRSRLLDAVALTERGMKSTLADFKIMLEHGATHIIFQTFEGDNMISEEVIK